MRTSTFAFAALVSLVGCADSDDKIPVGDGTVGFDTNFSAEGQDGNLPPTAPPGLVLRVVGGDGEAPPVAQPWPEKEAAFIRLEGSVTAADVVDANYVFRVLDVDNNVLSTDLAACRRFHVNQFGRIDSVLPGVDALGDACEPITAITGNQLPVIKLIPYANAAIDQDGLMHFVVQISPEEVSFDGNSVLRTEFDVVTSNSGGGSDSVPCDAGTPNAND